MYGKKVKLRTFFILLIFLSVALTIFLIFKALEENVVYFKSPTEVKNLPELTTKKIRVGGMVKKNSIITNDTEINFIITDISCVEKLHNTFQNHMEQLHHFLFCNISQQLVNYRTDNFHNILYRIPMYQSNFLCFCLSEYLLSLMGP